MGELHPQWRQAYELPAAPLLCELDLDAVLARDLPSPYHVDDTWEAFDRLAPTLDASRASSAPKHDEISSDFPRLMIQPPLSR